MGKTLAGTCLGCIGLPLILFLIGTMACRGPETLKSEVKSTEEDGWSELSCNVAPATSRENKLESTEFRWELGQCGSRKSGEPAVIGNEKSLNLADVSYASIKDIEGGVRCVNSSKKAGLFSFGSPIESCADFKPDSFTCEPEPGTTNTTGYGCVKFTLDHWDRHKPLVEHAFPEDAVRLLAKRIDDYINNVKDEPTDGSATLANRTSKLKQDLGQFGPQLNTDSCELWALGLQSVESDFKNWPKEIKNWPKEIPEPHHQTRSEVEIIQLSNQCPKLKKKFRKKLMDDKDAVDLSRYEQRLIAENLPYITVGGEVNALLNPTIKQSNPYTSLLSQQKKSQSEIRSWFEHHHEYGIKTGAFKRYDDAMANHIRKGWDSDALRCKDPDMHIASKIEKIEFSSCMTRPGCLADALDLTEVLLTPEHTATRHYQKLKGKKHVDSEPEDYLNKMAMIMRDLSAAINGPATSPKQQCKGHIGLKTWCECVRHHYPD